MGQGKSYGPDSLYWQVSFPTGQFPKNALNHCTCSNTYWQFNVNVCLIFTLVQKGDNIMKRTNISKSFLWSLHSVNMSPLLWPCSYCNSTDKLTFNFLLIFILSFFFFSLWNISVVPRGLIQRHRGPCTASVAFILPPHFHTSTTLFFNPSVSAHLFPFYMLHFSFLSPLSILLFYSFLKLFTP